jgi:hypothetical protein
LNELQERDIATDNRGWQTIALRNPVARSLDPPPQAARKRRFFCAAVPPRVDLHQLSDLHAMLVLIRVTYPTRVHPLACSRVEVVRQ